MKTEGFQTFLQGPAAETAGNRVHLVSPGKRHDTFLSDFINEYQKRLSPFYDIEWHFPSAGDKEDEGKKILGLLKDDDLVLLLDEDGKKCSTPYLANLLESAKNEGAKRLVIIIGGSYGVSEAVTSRANQSLSLSDLVLPHMLVRAIIIEQLYRANSLLVGGKYHHE